MSDRFVAEPEAQEVQRYDAPGIPLKVGPRLIPIETGCGKAMQTENGQVVGRRFGDVICGSEQMAVMSVTALTMNSCSEKHTFVEDVVCLPFECLTG